MADAFFRFLNASGCATQEELAAFLRIRQASVAHAKRRSVIPATWLLKLLRKTGVNPDWVLSGHGPKFFLPAPAGPDAPVSPPGAVNPEEQSPGSLDAFSAQELVNELVRRALPSVAPEMPEP